MRESNERRKSRRITHINNEIGRRFCDSSGMSSRHNRRNMRKKEEEKYE